MTTHNQSESYGEFKGNTGAKLDILFVEIKELRNDMNNMQGDISDLKLFKAWAGGIGFAAGLIASMAKDMIFKRI